MASNEHIAHELTMLYLYNRYGAWVTGDFSRGHGSINNVRFPSVIGTEKATSNVTKGIKEFLGIGNVDERSSEEVARENFGELVAEYRQAYNIFLELLET